MSTRRRIVMNGGELPIAYQQVEYIQSSYNGGQYIDTNIQITTSNSLTIKTELDITLQTGSRCGIFGTGGYDGFGTYIGYTEMWDNYNDDVGVGIPDEFTGNLKIIKNVGNYTYITDSQTYTKTRESQSFSASSLYLFQKNTLNYPTADMLLKSFKVWIDGINLSYDFIPCYRKSDNEIGMYDTITKTFYTNQGTGTFTKGPDVK